MKRSKAKLAGWVLSGLIVVFMCLVSASGKFVDFPNKQEMFAKMGWTSDVMFYVGIVEVSIAVLFLIPHGIHRCHFVVSLSWRRDEYHVRIGEPFFLPIVFGVLVWIALGLRSPARSFNCISVRGRCFRQLSSNKCPQATERRSLPALRRREGTISIAQNVCGGISVSSELGPLVLRRTARQKWACYNGMYYRLKLLLNYHLVPLVTNDESPNCFRYIVVPVYQSAY